MVSRIPSYSTDRLRREQVRQADEIAALQQDNHSRSGAASGGGGAAPTGTGFRHVTAGVEDAAAAYPSRPPGAQWESKTAISVSLATPIDVFMPYACTLTGVYVMTQGGTGSCVVDIRAAAFPTIPSASICGAAKPTIAVGTTYSDTSLTGWTAAIAAGTRLRFVLESSSVFNKITLYLKVA